MEKPDQRLKLDEFPDATIVAIDRPELPWKERLFVVCAYDAYGYNPDDTEFMVMERVLYRFDEWLRYGDFSYVISPSEAWKQGCDPSGSIPTIEWSEISSTGKVFLDR